MRTPASKSKKKKKKKKKKEEEEEEEEEKGANMPTSTSSPKKKRNKRSRKRKKVEVDKSVECTESEKKKRPSSTEKTSTVAAKRTTTTSPSTTTPVTVSKGTTAQKLRLLNGGHVQDVAAFDDDAVSKVDLASRSNKWLKRELKRRNANSQGRKSQLVYRLKAIMDMEKNQSNDLALKENSDASKDATPKCILKKTTKKTKSAKSSSSELAKEKPQRECATSRETKSSSETSGSISTLRDLSTSTDQDLTSMNRQQLQSLIADREGLSFENVAKWKMSMSKLIDRAKREKFKEKTKETKAELMARLREMGVKGFSKNNRKATLLEMYRTALRESSSAKIDTASVATTSESAVVSENGVAGKGEDDDDEALSEEHRVDQRKRATQDSDDSNSDSDDDDDDDGDIDDFLNLCGKERKTAPSYYIFSKTVDPRGDEQENATAKKKKKKFMTFESFSKMRH